MDIEIYKSSDGKVSVEVSIGQETVWLSLNQLALLFERDKSVVAKHIKNIFKAQELEQNAVVANFATTANDGKTYLISHYNLDMIISVGYRVNSKQGVQFRQWASKILKDYLIQGYTLNQKRLASRGVEEMQKSIELMARVLQQHGGFEDISAATISIIKEYSKTWHILLQYDENTLELPKGKKAKKYFNSQDALVAITKFKTQLMELGEASELFGRERKPGLGSILNNTEQTFDKIMLYPTIEIRAAHLLYFVIKDHPFVDGNKRIACLLFMIYARASGISLHALVG